LVNVLCGPQLRLAVPDVGTAISETEYAGITFVGAPGTGFAVPKLAPVPELLMTV
jgi:hypothetical protein